MKFSLKKKERVWEIGPILIIPRVDFEKAFFYIKLNLKSKKFSISPFKTQMRGLAARRQIKEGFIDGIC